MTTANDNSIHPNFIIAGAARSGTTALYHWLRAHPQVFMPAVKETNYFSQLQPNFTGPGDAEALNRPLERNPDGTFVSRGAAIITSWNEYMELFAGSEEFIARGEASPSYLYYSYAAANIKGVLPQCKIVILLRNPVERAFSNYKALVRAGREHLDFESALERGKQRVEDGWEHFWDLKGLGLYHMQVKRYLDLFPREQVGIWLYEDMRSDPARFYREISLFIGVNDSFELDFTKHNATKPKVGPLRRFFMRHRSIRKSLRKLVPRSIRPLFRSIEDSLFATPLVLKPDTREYLLEYYREDIVKLARLLPNLNVMQWIEAEERKLSNAKQ